MIGSTVGDYRITEKLGEGGFGVVYKAVHVKAAGQFIAVKRLAPAPGVEPAVLAQRVEVEAAAQARLYPHPNIVALHGVQCDERGAFLLTELIPAVTIEQGVARSLDDMLHLRGALAPTEVRRIISQVLPAVGFAHRQGIVHGGLKPANVLLTKSGAKVTDFGIVRMVCEGPGTSPAGRRVGTPDYMAPEQILNEPVSARTDIYALGAMLYAMAAGEPPFKPTATASVERQHLNVEPPVERVADRQLARVILKAMAKKPAERFQSCEEFAAALQDVGVASQPRLSPPDPGPDRAPRESVLSPSGPRERPRREPRPEAVGKARERHTGGQASGPASNKAAKVWATVALAVAVGAVLAAVGICAKSGGRWPARVETGGPMQALGINAQWDDESLWLKDSSVVIRIPAGTFTMGSPEEGEGDADEHPQHQVYLDEYYIDKYEVTNRQYKRFCDATGRSYPEDPGFSGMSDYFRSYPSYPVVNVSWEDAQAYCTWAGKRLPTEAEWEKAARGTDARKYPWGNSEPSGQRCNCADCNTGYSWRDANVDDGYAWTAPFGTYPAGASPHGCMDMAGNVWEWCDDWYGSDYYGSSASNNPQGPSSGSSRVIRGGSWAYYTGDLRAANRNWHVPVTRFSSLGFRCAWSETSTGGASMSAEQAKVGQSDTTHRLRRPDTSSVERQEPVPPPRRQSAPSERATQPAPTPPTTPTAGTSFQIAGPISQREISKKVKPRYPEWALQQRISGTVTVRIWVMPNGKVKGAPQVTHSSGYPDLDQVVVEALRLWEFAPLGAGVKSEDQWGDVTLLFNMW